MNEKGKDFIYAFSRPSWSIAHGVCTLSLLPAIVGSVKVIFLSYRYRADKSTIFGMRGLWVLTINSGRGAMLKYL